MKKMISQAFIAHQEGRLKEAEQLYQSILKNQPTNLDVNNNLGVILQNQGRFNEAIACYKKAIELKPDYAEAHNNLGNIWYELGKIDKAAENYKKAIQLKSDFVNAWHNILFPLQIIKLQDSSFKDYSPFLNEQVNCKYAQINKSILHYRLNLGGLSSNNSLNDSFL